MRCSLHRAVLHDLAFDSWQIPHLAGLSDETKAQLALTCLTLIGYIMNDDLIRLYGLV